MPEKGKIKNRVGEIHITNQGYKITIIQCFGANNYTICFEDGTILEYVSYSNIKKGAIGKPVYRNGEKWMSNEGYEMTIISSDRSGEYSVKLNDWNGTILTNLRYTHIKRGAVKNPYHPSVSMVGYLGIGKYSEKNAVKHPAYKKWRGMLLRVYVRKKENPSYKTATVSEEWHNFQNFAKWFEENYESHMDSSWELDKDILIKGNKHYSPETCCLVPAVVNLLLVKNDTKRGKYPIGVTKVKSGKFKAQMLKNGVQIPLGLFKTILETFECYKFHKESHIKETVEEWKNLIKFPVYQSLLNYQVEITD